MQDIVNKRRLRYTGHVLRYPMNRHRKTALKWIPPGGKRSRGRPRQTWRRTYNEDLRAMGVKEEEVESITADRGKWGSLVDQFIADDDGGTKV